MLNPDLLTVEETAAVLRINRQTVYRLIKSGKLPAFKVASGIRIEQAAIKEYLEGCRMVVEEKRKRTFRLPKKTYRFLKV
jgi:excisionase family DNA binding protein